MSFITPLRVGTSVAAIMVSGAANADVTAAQVWDNWHKNFAVYGDDGLSFDAEETSGDTLTVKNVALNFAEDGTTVSADIGDIVFVENGDGTVSVTMGSSYPITVTENGTDIEILVSQTGLVIVASGTPEAMNYQFNADQYVIELPEFSDAGNPDVSGLMRFTANGMAGTYTITEGDLRNMTYAASIDSMDMLLDASEPATEERVLVSGQFNQLTAAAVVAIPADADMNAPEDMFLDGFAIEGGYGISGASFLFDVDADGEAFAGSASLGQAEVSLVFNKDRAGYDAASNDIAFQFITPELPFPVDVSLAQYGLGFSMPLSRTDAPAPFSMALNLADLVVNDEIWALGDPAGQLPRDPLTVRLDVTGAAKVLFDLLDPEQTEAMEMADMPIEIHELSLNDLTVRAIGAAITGAGAFTFDNSDLQTFNGVPRPAGEVTVNINGANALIDTLVGMGLVPEDQAGMGRMMMGMFARKVGDDQLTSTVEINDQGHVVANGQRIQ